MSPGKNSKNSFADNDSQHNNLFNTLLNNQQQVVFIWQQIHSNYFYLIILIAYCSFTSVSLLFLIISFKKEKKIYFFTYILFEFNCSNTSYDADYLF